MGDRLYWEKCASVTTGGKPLRRRAEGTSMSNAAFAPYGIGDPSVQYWVFVGSRQVGQHHGIDGALSHARMYARNCAHVTIKDRTGRIVAEWIDGRRGGGVG